ncbi:PREDICTED: far upstream element-binding protein 2 isoform X1 [Nicotiana attenuata]|uniref:far upstream element-binding protein 2 isoform X1 n=1 Tax=Nicotiana attenuata TaxID=49451 RepID=UPI000904FB1B|nr:PREDICTED: far upstream element-binding protein 2 isoform X1 [Nicotiana attenuata]
MAEEAQYAAAEAGNNKRKYEDQTTPPPGSRRPTGFSAPISSVSPPDGSAPPSSYNSVPPPVDDFQLAKQKAQEIAARLFNSAEAKKPRVDNNGSGAGAGGFDSYERKDKPIVTPSVTSSYGYPGQSKKIEIPNGRVGVIIGKGGETIKYLQLQSGAKIQVTRDMDADPNSPNRAVELMGTPDQIAKAEQLITEVLSEADSGGSGLVNRRLPGQQSGGEQFSMKVPNNKVGLVIGKGGETIKNMQARTGARIQVIPLHLPPGDTSQERTVQIDGSSEQIEAAKQLVYEVISENRARNPGMGGGYQQGYQARPPTSWAPPGAPMQQPGYGYVQPGAYPGPSPQYNTSQQPYPGYPPQPASAGYASGWDQTAAQNQQSQGGGYDYYNQQAPPQQQQTPGGTAASTDNSAYGYNQQSASGYSQGQAYSQDGYGGYHAPAPQSGYQGTGYEQQQGYSSAAGYGNASNPTSDGQNASYGTQGDGSQAPPPVQSSATGQQGSYPSQGSTQAGYGMPPTSQGGYGTPPPAGYAASYGAPQAQKPSPSQPAYGQPQQSPSAQGGYAQPPPAQPGYPQSAAQSGYAQPDSGTQRPPASGYGAPTAQPGYGAPPYGAPPSYGQQQPPPYNSAYAGGYAQPPAYASDGTTPASQSVQPSGGVAKASPQT